MTIGELLARVPHERDENSDAAWSPAVFGEPMRMLDGRPALRAQIGAVTITIEWIVDQQGWRADACVGTRILARRQVSSLVMVIHRLESDLVALAESIEGIGERARIYPGSDAAEPGEGGSS